MTFNNVYYITGFRKIAFVHTDIGLNRNYLEETTSFFVISTCHVKSFVWTLERRLQTIH